MTTMKTFSLDNDSAEKLAQLQSVDGFNASAMVRNAIKYEYSKQLGVMTTDV